MTVLAGAFPTIVSLSNWIAYRMVSSRRVFGVQRRAVGRVSLIGAGPGAADLITLRGMRRLQEADVVYFDRLADPALPDLARPGARRVNVGKAPGHHPVPQERINQLLVESALAGQNVVRLKCGDPGVFGRGAEEACACAAAGLEVEIIPGVTAASGAAAAAGGFLTERGCTDRVILVTGHVQSGPRTDWTGMSLPGTTLVIYMGLAGLNQTAEGLMEAGWPSAALVEIVCNAQATNQSVLNTTLARLPDLRAPRAADGPVTVLIRWPSGMAKSAGCDGRAPPAFVPPNKETSDLTASL
jgi:uroporphyrin-III C-methyltransferase